MQLWGLGKSIVQVIGTDGKHLIVGTQLFLIKEFWQPVVLFGEAGFPVKFHLGLQHLHSQCCIGLGIKRYTQPHLHHLVESFCGLAANCTTCQ